MTFQLLNVSAGVVAAPRRRRTTTTTVWIRPGWRRPMKFIKLMFKLLNEVVCRSGRRKGVSDGQRCGFARLIGGYDAGVWAGRGWACHAVRKGALGHYGSFVVFTGHGIAAGGDRLAER
ncbi:hypothetical protein MTY59_00260 [Mycobacterium senriense]|uniref:Uncharacterized protein n=1 Tax=Mycobacterium senriense TaxID=2775496 RepID=A0ABN6IBG5_9MYCO|nr:hypothetical protein MTY59_00260 [Mycobacterium senriense]